VRVRIMGACTNPAQIGSTKALALKGVREGAHGIRTTALCVSADENLCGRVQARGRAQVERVQTRGSELVCASCAPGAARASMCARAYARKCVSSSARDRLRATCGARDRARVGACVSACEGAVWRRTRASPTRERARVRASTRAGVRTCACASVQGLRVSEHAL